MQLPIHYGLHRHFTGSGSVVMWGGGNEAGSSPRRDRARSENAFWHDARPDRHQSICTPRSSPAMGISPRAAFDIERACWPFYATEDGKVLRPVNSLFARAARG